MPALIDGVLNARSFWQWAGRGFSAPAPSIVKRAVVRRNSLKGGVFVETGTFFGDTSAAAAKYSHLVLTIEPAKVLYDAAVTRFAGSSNVRVVNAPSEVALPDLLPTLSGAATFWLDGHYSGSITYDGELHSPLVQELQTLSTHIHQFSPLVVMVDDIEACGQNPDYPPMSFVLDWATRHGMTWRIEHDIMVMGRP